MSRKRKHGVSSPVDVVIVTGGRWDFLSECLSALHDVNVILIDNATDADERRQNDHLFENVLTKRLQNPVGYAEANNEGARMGRAPYILFLNDDCIVKEDTIEKMVDTLKKQDVGIVGAKLTFPIDSTHPTRPAGKVQHVGLALNIRGEVIHPLVGWSPDNPKTCVTRDVWGVTGACLMIKRSLFNFLRGFDTAFGAGTYEDADLCLRTRASGFRIILNAEAKAVHFAGATAEKKRVSFPLQFNALTFKSKWLNSPLMAWGTPEPNSWVGEGRILVMSDFLQIPGELNIEVGLGDDLVFNLYFDINMSMFSCVANAVSEFDGSETSFSVSGTSLPSGITLGMTDSQISSLGVNTHKWYLILTSGTYSRRYLAGDYEIRAYP